MSKNKIEDNIESIDINDKLLQKAKGLLNRVLGIKLLMRI